MNSKQKELIDAERKILINKGISLKRDGDYEGALNYYFKAKNIDGGNYEIDYTIAKTYYLMENYNEALKYYKNASAYFLIKYDNVIIEDKFDEIISIYREYYEYNTKTYNKITSIFPEKILLTLIDLNVNLHLGYAFTALNEFSKQEKEILNHYRAILNGKPGTISNMAKYRTRGFMYVLEHKNEIYQIKRHIFCSNCNT